MSKTPDPSNDILVPSGGLKVSWALGCVGLGAALLCITAAIIIPIYSSAGASFETTQCLSHLRRLARASFLYADDNNGVLPGEHWDESLVKYEPDEVSYACPHQRRIDPRSSGFALAKGLAGKTLKDIPDQPITTLFFDSRTTVPGAIADPTDIPRPGRHKNGRANNVVYADGRSASVEVR